MKWGLHACFRCLRNVNCSIKEPFCHGHGCAPSVVLCFPLPCVPSAPLSVSICVYVCVCGRGLPSWLPAQLLLHTCLLSACHLSAYAHTHKHSISSSPQQHLPWLNSHLPPDRCLSSVVVQLRLLLKRLSNLMKLGDKYTLVVYCVSV